MSDPIPPYVALPSRLHKRELDEITAFLYLQHLRIHGSRLRDENELEKPPKTFRVTFFNLGSLVNVEANKAAI